MNIKRRSFVRIISFFVTLAVILSAFCLKASVEKYYLKERIELGYKQSLSEFSSLISKINFDLKKQLYSSDESMLTALSTDIHKNSAAAKECLERLPVSQENAENIYKFLATAGDFSRAVALSDSDEILKNREQLQQLIGFSQKLTDGVMSAAMQMEESDSLSQDVDNLLDNLENETNFSALAEDVSEIASDAPTLIYDGPFSDHINQREAAAIKDKAEISKQQALKKAVEITGEDDLKYCCDEESNTESYIFEDEETVCAITKKGGLCLYMNKETDADESNISVEKAISTAKNFLNKITGLNFIESYYIISENILTVNLAFYENDIVHYSDLIKVGVDLEDGEVVAIEARGFVLNYHARSKHTFKHSEKQAQKMISDTLKVNSVQKALIADDALNEIYCYEFKCSAADGGDVIVYVKDDDLKEQDIFIIIHTDGGTLVS